MVPDVGRGRRARERPSQPLLAPEVLLLLPQREIEKGRLGILSGQRQIMSAYIAMKRGIGRGSVHNSSLAQGKMTKKPFVGQSTTANGLLDLVHTDVCGPLSIAARGGFSYFITFTDDHLRYGYVYLMRYKFETFRRFKE
ncbi:UNVERIFIED_CONTAM: hypothetical protein Sradi_2063300 [Sesamum radiatum]|uniref:Uncharacterized protein n=1 Tax=Sesamum radiatum TaxID=300843 RepID=A0AAW2THD6_SESRA